MLVRILAALALLVPAVQDAPKEKREQKIKVAVHQLEKAFKRGGSAERIRAIRNNARYGDPRVIELVARGLTDKDRTVHEAAVLALGRMRHQDAFDLLVEYADRRRPDLVVDPPLFAAVLRATAAHERPQALALLTRDPLVPRDGAVLRARILGLARLRATRSVEALVSLLARLKKDRERMTDLRLALVVLTGEDHGMEGDAWLAWWDEAREGYELPEEAPLPDELRTEWESYWGPLLKKKRAKGRDGGQPDDEEPDEKRGEERRGERGEGSG